MIIGKWNKSVILTYIGLIFSIFGICGIARLADFNIKVENSGQPIKYYTGLPVTYTALIFPLIYLLKYILPLNLFNIIFTISIYLVSVLNVLNIKLLKPKGIAYLFFSFLAIIVLVLYWRVL